MCYYVSVKEKNQLRGILPDSVKVLDYQPGYFQSGFTHPDLPVMTMEQPDLVQPIEWGLIPKWARSDQEAAELQNKTLNARSETIFTTPMFRSYAPGNRCLIFVDGFFEWKHVGKEKIPHFIYLDGHRPFALGGLYADWSRPNTPGEQIRTCSIVTTASNDLMTDIHNTKHRMPLILPLDSWDTWMNPSATQDEVMLVAQPYTGNLKAHAVRKINLRVDNNTPSVQEPRVWNLPLF